MYQIVGRLSITISYGHNNWNKTGTVEDVDVSSIGMESHHAHEKRITVFLSYEICKVQRAIATARGTIWMAAEELGSRVQNFHIF